MRFLALGIGVALAVVSAPTAPAAGPVAGPGPLPSAGVVYAAPVRSPLDVVRPFDPPVTQFGPGHLGVDLATHPGEPVRAAADGVVSFAGSVAGRGLIVLAHPDGVTTEYEPLDVLVSTGDVVTRGEIIGHVDGVHGDCAPAGCLHWGARRDGVYLDPLSLLAALGPVRLLPWPAGTTDP